MGYEVTLKVVDVSPRRDHDGRSYAQVIGSVELGKLAPGSFYELHSKSKPKEVKVFFYADDGDTEVVEDRYGETLSVMSPYLVISKLQEDQKRLIASGEWGTRGYYAYDVAIAFLTTLMSHEGFDRVRVMGYGH